MAAPTPVSALVHSSTLVTAGVYLVIRFSPSFRYWLNIILLLVSGLTMCMAGLGANFEFDLRRIIALSTLRQLGLMIMTISIGFSGLAFFHLFALQSDRWVQHIGGIFPRGEFHFIFREDGWRRFLQITLHP